MDNRTALVLIGALAALFAADAFYFEWGLPILIGKQLANVSDWLAFWR